MAHSFFQHSFGGGIISPQVFSRTDTKKYEAGLRVCSNMLIQRFGSVQSRPGTQYLDIEPAVDNSVAYSGGVTYPLGSVVSYLGALYIALVTNNSVEPTHTDTWAPYTSGKVRLVKFVFDFNNSYELVFSRTNIRIYKNGVQIVVKPGAWSSATAYVIGNTVMDSGNAYICRSPATNFQPSLNPGFWKKMVQVGSSGTYYLDIPLNYAASNTITLPDASLPVLQAVNYNSIMTVTSQYFPPFQITRLSDTSWTVTPLTLAPSQVPPIASGVTAGVAGTVVHSYVITAISGTDGSESLASNTVSVTSGDPTGSNPNVITWSPAAGASSYKVYHIVNGIPGFIGTTTLSSLFDTNVQPNYASQPPVFLTNADGSALFSTAGNYPATCCFFQQRLCFANTVNQPTSVWMSRVGSFSNFAVSTPIADSDAILFVVAGKSAQPIVALVDLQKLIIHTASAEYAATGNQFGTITPTAINIVQQGSAGCSLPPPVVIGNTDIFVQARGTQLRDLRFNIQSYTYTGKDLTIYSTQMFAGLTVVDMDWQQIKDSIIWMVMSNGTVYGCTYVPEEDVWAWHQHSFANGFAENVLVVPNASADTVYFIVRRVINGVTVRYLESLTPRDYLDTVFYSDFVGCDCSLVYNGTYTAAPSTLGLLSTSTSGGWTTSDLITLTSTLTPFAATDVTNGNQVVLSQYGSNGLVTDRVTFTITTFISSSQVKGYPLRSVPAWAQNVTNFTNWGKAVTQFSGLTQLAGQNISVFADGNVVANALGTAFPTITVSPTGTFSIPHAAMIVVAGLPIQCDGQTLPLENSQGETVQNKHMVTKECTPIFYFSRGGVFGQDTEHLLPWKQPRGATPPQFPYTVPVAPYTGSVRIPVQGTFDTTGQVCWRLTEPIPLAMSGVITTVEISEG